MKDVIALAAGIVLYFIFIHLTSDIVVWKVKDIKRGRKVKKSLQDLLESEINKERRALDDCRRGRSVQN